MTATYKILIATDLTEESMSILQNASDVEIHVVAPTLSAVRESIKDAHAIIARDDVVLDAELITHAENLKIIGRPSAGVTGINLETATQRGIIVMNVPGISAISAGEHTMTLMLALSRGVISAHNSMREGFWLMDRKRQAGTQLYGKTLGIIGLGRVGHIVASRALTFGMTVLAYDPYLGEDQVSDERIILVGLRDLLARSDFVSLHVPETNETRQLINAERLSQMKEGARLINTSHGRAIVESAVSDALSNGHLAGVAVDVYADEPPYNSPLIGQDGVIHTPHIGDNTIEATHDLSNQIAQQVLDALHGDDYRNVINMPFLPGVDFESIRPILTLAERIGLLAYVLSRSPIVRVAVEFRGDELDGLVKPLTVAMLKGLLTPILGDTVSYINAPLLASQRGIQITQAKGLRTRDYTNLVSCQITLEDGEEIIMAGTLLDHKHPYIVQVNEYHMDFVPEGHLLIIGSYDKPGVIGRVGMLMADNQVNIASWHTGREQPGGNTLTVLTLDQPLPEELMNELLAQDFIRHAHQVEVN